MHGKSSISLRELGDKAMAFLFYKFTGTVTFQWVRIVIAAFGDQQTIKRSQCSEKALQTSSSHPGRFDSSSLEPTSVFHDRNDSLDRKRDVEGKSVSVRVIIGGRRIMK